MAYFGDAVNRLTGDRIAKTPTMKGYVRRHVMAYRTDAADGEVGDNVADGHKYFTAYDYSTSAGTAATSSNLSDTRALLVLNPADRDYPAGSDHEADFRFRYEFVENPSWANKDGDKKILYAVDCWQWGGSVNSTSYDRRVFRVTTRATPGSAESSAPAAGATAFTVAWLLENATVGSDSGLYGTYTISGSTATPASSDLLLDNETLAILMASDWTYDVPESEYVASMSSLSRW